MSMRARSILALICLIGLPSFIAGPVFAEDTVLFGLNIPLTGSYAKQGEDQLKAYKLAIQKVNDEGGILGKKVVYSIKDSKTNAEVARENAKALIAEGAVMITGGSSSAEAISQAEEAQKAGVIFMAALTHSNDTTGKAAHRHTFRWYSNGHQSAKAMGSLLSQKFGPGAKYAFIYANYTWGTTIFESMKAVAEKNGGKIVLAQTTELGKKSYIADLLEAKKAEADVLVLVHFGDDMVNALKQATQLKLRESMAIVVPLMEIHMAHPLGPEIMQGVITTMPWYHELSEKYEGSKVFVTAFEQEYKKKPCNSAAVAWVDILQYAEAVKRAGSFDHLKVIKALEGHHFKLLEEDEYWREWDHQGIHQSYVAIGKTPQESKNEWDLFKIVSIHKGNEMARTREENPVQLEPLE